MGMSSFWVRKLSVSAPTLVKKIVISDNALVSSFRDPIISTPQIKPSRNLYVSHDFFDSSSIEEFSANMVRYTRYFLTVMLGTTYMMIKPVTSLFNARLSSFLAFCGILGILYFLYFILIAMVGLSEGLQ